MPQKTKPGHYRNVHEIVDGYGYKNRHRVNDPVPIRCAIKMAEPTGLEPATSDVTGRRSNQLNYDSAFQIPKLGPEISKNGRHGGTRTPNLFLVREAVYH